MKAIRRIALAAGNLSIMAVLGSPCALAQSGDGHTGDGMAAHDQAAGGRGHKDETSLSEAEWFKKAGDGHGDDATQNDHGDTGHGDHDRPDEVAAAQLDDASPDDGTLDKGVQPVMSEEDWMKAPVDDHHDGKGQHTHS